MIALLSSVALALWPIPERKGMDFWIFAEIHARMYEPIVERWNAERDTPVSLFTISAMPMSRRALAGFWSETPTADLMEIERSAVGPFLSGPIEDVGFVDLTDRLKAEGIYDRINAPSFSPWTSRGRIFGLPHDVHPVLLAYRADLVEEAGIDVSTIETWDDFSRVMRPLIADLDGDGSTDRYLLNYWYTAPFDLQTLILQAGGGTFDPDGRMLIDSEANALVIATAAQWCVGSTRIAIDAPEFTASGNRLKLDGRVVAALMPDWLAGVWMKDLPQLSGKIKLMPLPAWTPGGRRTSVTGGTMIAITKLSQHQQAAWAFAKHLYLSPELAEQLFVTNHIISPVRDLWTEPFYQQPIPYFQGQKTGLAYIEQAPHVPHRPSSPFNAFALNEVAAAAAVVYRYAQDNGSEDRQALMAVAREALAQGAERTRREMARNVFLDEGAP
ncbi:MAG: extracellular solute-binding protein [Phycisphaeraceae bacterium]